MMRTTTALVLAAALFLPMSLAAASNERLERSFIVGGREAQPGAWPWQVRFEPGDYECGGSLIAPDWVLTAAHCIYDDANSRIQAGFMRVILGAHDYSVEEPSQQRISVAEAIQHEGYRIEGEDNDVALLRLVTPVRLTDRVQVVALTTTADDAAIAGPGTVATIAGWGATAEGGETSLVLRQVSLTLLSNPDCAAGFVAGRITDNMICAIGPNEGGQDTCQGDSGGPLVVPSGASFKQAGIVSFGDGCARPGVPGAYVRVSRYTDWISARTGLLIGEPQPPTVPASGLQTTADGAVTLVNKPLGGAQWAITQSDDGSVTGNIFYTDGRDPQFVDCLFLRDDGDTDPAARLLEYSCSLASKCDSAGCPAADDWTPIGEASLAGSFFLPRPASGVARVVTDAPEPAGDLGAPTGGTVPASGLQTTADGVLTLVNKPLGGAQWAITQHADGSVTGNIFYTDGRDPQFVDCLLLGDDGNTDPAARVLRYSCSLSSKCHSAGCPAAADWTSIGEATLLGSFFLPRVP